MLTSDISYGVFMYIGIGRDKVLMYIYSYVHNYVGVGRDEVLMNEYGRLGLVGPRVSARVWRVSQCNAKYE